MDLTGPATFIARAALVACLVRATLAGPQFARTCRVPDPTKPSRSARCQFFHTAAQPQQSGRPTGLCFERISDIRESGLLIRSQRIAVVLYLRAYCY